MSLCGEQPYAVASPLCET